MAASTGLWPPLIFLRKYSSLTAWPPYFGSSSLNLHQTAAGVQRSDMEGKLHGRESPHAWKCSASEFKRVPSMSTAATWPCQGIRCFCGPHGQHIKAWKQHQRNSLTQDALHILESWQGAVPTCSSSTSWCKIAQTSQAEANMLTSRTLDSCWSPLGRHAPLLGFQTRLEQRAGGRAAAANPPLLCEIESCLQSHAWIC